MNFVGCSTSLGYIKGKSRRKWNKYLKGKLGENRNYFLDVFTFLRNTYVPCKKL